MTSIASVGTPARPARTGRPGFPLLAVRRLRRRRSLRVLSVELAQEVLVVLDGHLVDETAFALDETIDALPASARVVLDMSRLRSIDRAGVDAVRRMHRRPDQEILAFADRARVRRRLARHGGGAGLVLLARPVGA